ncbi:MAG: alpha/beta hydrolase [Planctomycetota bacterium]
MSDPVKHVPGVRTDVLRTARLRTQVVIRGDPAGEPVLFLHGNFSAATIWEELLAELPPEYLAVAPDQRGYGCSDTAALIDSTRGVADWADDALALADHYQWDAFHLVAHSLGGCVAWDVLGRAPRRLLSATLFAPGPPCGFGGARGRQGDLIQPDGAGSGAGLVHPEVVRRIAAEEREIVDERASPRALMRRLFFKPPFVPDREEDLLTAMLQIHPGHRQFPGDFSTSPHWPGFVPGCYGPINALAPLYNQGVLRRMLAADEKPPLLWIYGEDDLIVADESPSDPGCQGRLGLRPGWPGEQQFPPQPLLTQVEHAVDEYDSGGGAVRRLTLSGVGHTPFLERPNEVLAALVDHLGRNGLSQQKK